MAIDPVSKEIIRLVRSLPDEALLALVATHLGKVSGGGKVSRAVVSAARTRAAEVSRKSSRKPARKAKPKPPPPKRKARSAKRAGRSNAGRQELVAAVERAIQGGNGLSASEIAKAANVPQPRVASALKELKRAKRIFQGGDRRFARYAGTAAQAEAASAIARETASGPILKKKKKP